jgi:hypothetical protein
MFNLFGGKDEAALEGEAQAPATGSMFLNMLGLGGLDMESHFKAYIQAMGDIDERTKRIESLLTQLVGIDAAGRLAVQSDASASGPGLPALPHAAPGNGSAAPSGGTREARA